MLKIFFMVSLVGVMAISGGCASGQVKEKLVVTDAASNVLVTEALSGLESAYYARNTVDFIGLLDKDFPGFLEFQDGIDKYFNAHSELQIHFVIDTCLGSGDRVNARLHWYRSVVDRVSGAITKAEGFSQLIFRKTESGPKLLSIQNDNPFF